MNKKFETMMKRRESVFDKELFSVRFYRISQVIILLATAGVWIAWGWTLGVVLLTWFALNAITYVVGSQDSCIDDYDYDNQYPSEGVRKMLRFWRWYLPLAAFLASALCLGLVGTAVLVIFIIFAIVCTILCL